MGRHAGEPTLQGGARGGERGTCGARRRHAGRSIQQHHEPLRPSLTRLPRSLVEELARATSKAQPEWVAAKKAKDFESLRPSLELIFQLKRPYAACLSDFGLPYDAFWCCTGSGVESFSKLADTVFWRDGDNLRVNLYVASELDWSEKKIRIVMDTRFPEEEVARLTIRGSARFALKLRIPEWTQPGGSVKLNGKPVDAFADPGGAVVLDREWKDGETVELRLPMGNWQWRMPDDESMRAHMKGPLVLAADLGEEKARATPTKPRAIPEYQSEPAKPPATPDGLALKPLYQMIDRRYATYWKHS